MSTNYLSDEEELKCPFCGNEQRFDEDSLNEATICLRCEALKSWATGKWRKGSVPDQREGLRT